MSTSAFSRGSLHRWRFSLSVIIALVAGCGGHSVDAVPGAMDADTAEIAEDVDTAAGDASDASIDTDADAGASDSATSDVPEDTVDAADTLLLADGDGQGDDSTAQDQDAADVDDLAFDVETSAPADGVDVDPADAPPDTLDAALDANTSAPVDSVDGDAADALADTQGGADDADTSAPMDSVDGDSADAVDLSANVTCDAGDEEWVRRAMPLLAGRKPTGINEVRVLAKYVGQLGRAKVAAAMMQGPGFEARWTDHLYDTLRVSKAGGEARILCSDVTLKTSDTGQWAAWVRNHGPAVPYKLGSGSLRDLAVSSLRLDDLRPLLLGRLVAQMSTTDEYSMTPDKIQIETTRRTTIGERFLAGYLGRNLSCLPCHNSTFGVGDNPNPLEDDHWPIAGAFEATLFGDSAGRPPAEVYAMFRYHDVMSISYLEEGEKSQALPDISPPVTPWGWTKPCGVVRVKSDLGPDPVGINGYFGGPLGKTASIWDVEALLRTGFADLAAWPDLNDTVNLATAPSRAFAWLTAVRLADTTWEFAMGAPLTQSHGFPHNPWQLARLKSLTVLLISNNWSLRTLLIAIALDPTFNPLPPSAGCGTAYPWPAIFQPYSVALLDPAVQGNGPGDAFHRENASALLQLAAQASGRTTVPALIDFDWSNLAFSLFNLKGVYPPKKFPAEALTAGLGAFLTGSFPGSNVVSYDFLANWRELLRFGTPVLPDGTPASPALSVDGKDWYAQLADAASTTDGTTLRDVVVALHDRFWGAPDVPPAVEPAIAAFFGVASLDIPIAQASDLDSKIPSYAGMLMADLQFFATPLPLPPQFGTPKLVVGDTSKVDACTTWADVLADPTVATVDCTTGDPVWLPAP